MKLKKKLVKDVWSSGVYDYPGRFFILRAIFISQFLSFGSVRSWGPESPHVNFEFDTKKNLKRKWRASTDSLQRWGLWLDGEFYPQFKVSSSLFCPTPTPTQHSAMSILNINYNLKLNQNLKVNPKSKVQSRSKIKSRYKVKVPNSVLYQNSYLCVKIPFLVYIYVYLYIVSIYSNII